MRSLAWKLSAAFCLVSLIGIVLVTAVTGQRANAISAELETRVNRNALVDRLEEWYSDRGGWPREQARAPRQLQRLEVEWQVVDENGRVILSEWGRSPPTRQERNAATPLQVDGQTVGYLLLRPTTAQTQVSEARQSFLDAMRSTLVLGGIGATVASLILGIAIARSLTRPLKELTTATREIAQGELATQVPVRSADEIGELSASFNKMAADLDEAQRLRRQMTADIAHDLRTPLSVILGHAEGLIDGVLPADEEMFSIIHDEAIRLNRLVDDLRTLSLADAGELPLVQRPVAPEELVERAVTIHSVQAQEKAVALQTHVTPNLPEVNVDSDRMAQVLDNLVGNALRYTPTGGAVNVSAARVNGSVQIQVQDSGQGIPAADLPHIFERFYRADKSRQRDGSGSGLGLAISKSIVEQHGGRISAASQPNHGTTFTIKLPIASSLT